ncbi:NAD(P)-dependent oxidoreductase [Rubrivirga sp.]|uniref:NAD(P)-dependent oxidoreductase n=1 Tax=Rubrivirga sp. TaxID=1885344 RepID=UPI003C7142C3
MRILVIGSTGGTGRATIQALLREGHTVTAFARSLTPQPALDPRVTLVQGDALVAADLDRAMPGHDAVVVALGVTGGLFQIRFQRGLTTPIDIASRGTAGVLRAMDAHGASRLVVVSGFGAADSWKDLPGVVRFFMSTFLKAPFEDKGVQEAMVRQSDRDWTILRPVGLTNRPSSGSPLVSPSGDFRSTAVPRADVADTIVKALADATTHGATLTLSA